MNADSTGPQSRPHLAHWLLADEARLLAEIETVLLKVEPGPYSDERLTPDELTSLLKSFSGPRFADMDEFSGYLRSATKDFTPPGNGVFERPATTLRFFDDPQNENILADIRQKNEAEGMGNFVIPGTDIELINFSKCPHCGLVYSFKELGQYYANPVSDSYFGSTAAQKRRDSRVTCKECGVFFHAALVISDGLPQAECRFLCRNQTIEYIEIFFWQFHKTSVLSRQPQNHVVADGYTRIKNDVPISRLSSEPALVVNFLQYMDTKLALNFVFERNIAAGDLVPDTIVLN